MRRSFAQASSDHDVCADLVLAGEMTVDASDVMNTVWPRAAAIAERLWSPQNITAIDTAAPRYSAYCLAAMAFRRLLVKRGFGAAPIPTQSPEVHHSTLRFLAAALLINSVPIQLCIA
jgi:hypothetical protein